MILFESFVVVEFGGGEKKGEKELIIFGVVNEYCVFVVLVNFW